jgi:phosphate starvation-inducible membrane PsiE
MEPVAGPSVISGANETSTTSEAIMRLSNLVEGLVFFIGFLFICLVVMMRRQPQHVPLRVRSATSTSRRAGMAG